MRTFIAGAAGLILAVSVGAQAQVPPSTQRVQGVVSSISDSSIAIRGATGLVTQVPLLPNRTVTITAPIAIDQIQPGSFVATANKSQPDGSGVSIELRVFPPNSAPNLVNRVMSAADQTVMTNGRVAKAVSSDGGRLLTVDYGSGSRQILVPANLAAVLNTPGAWDLVKVGRKATVATTPATAERPARQTVTIAKADLAP